MVVYVYLNLKLYKWRDKLIRIQETGTHLQANECVTACKLTVLWLAHL